MSFTEKVKWMLTSKDVDAAAIKMLKRVLIEDRSPVWFGVTSLCFAWNALLLSFFSFYCIIFWANFEKVDLPEIDPILIWLWQILPWLIFTLFLYGFIALGDAFLRRS